MKSMAAGEAKNKFGQLLDMAQREPVVIHKKGRATAVMMSYEDYEHYLRIEDELWASKAKLSAKGGFLTEKETREFMDEK